MNKLAKRLDKIAINPKLSVLRKIYGFLQVVVWIPQIFGFILNFAIPQSHWTNLLYFPPVFLATGYTLTTANTPREKTAFWLCLIQLLIATAILGWRIYFRLPTGGLIVFLACLIALLVGVITSYPENAKYRKTA